MDKELENAQKRINIMGSVLVDVVKLLALNQPDYIHEQIGDVMKAWKETEDKYPMRVD